MLNLRLIKIIVVQLFFLIPMSLQASGFTPTPPNDSCSVAIKIGTCETWRCDNTIYEICGNSIKEISNSEWNRQIQKLIIKEIDR